MKLFCMIFFLIFCFHLPHAGASEESKANRECDKRYTSTAPTLSGEVRHLHTSLSEECKNGVTEYLVNTNHVQEVIDKCFNFTNDASQTTPKSSVEENYLKAQNCLTGMSRVHNLFGSKKNQVAYSKHKKKCEENYLNYTISGDTRHQNTRNAEACKSGVDFAIFIHSVEIPKFDTSRFCTIDIGQKIIEGFPKLNDLVQACHVGSKLFSEEEQDASS